jgi:hypothetical protein
MPPHALPSSRRTLQTCRQRPNFDSPQKEREGERKMDGVRERDGGRERERERDLFGFLTLGL